jgi:redox-sensitive bicupin YhaK (pirin superfamily)
MTGIFMALFITALVWGIMSSFGSGTYGNSQWMGQTWNQPPQTPSQATPTYQAYDPELADESYQGYARGYRGESATPAARPPSAPPAQAQPQYDEPQMEYPREEPPLVQ